MKDIEPKFRCAACKRGVLNRSVPRCLYCGAGLPADARLAPDAIAQREASLARAEAERAHLALLAPAYPQERDALLNVIDGIEAGAAIAGLIGDMLS